MATHSSILAWEIPWTEEPDRLQSMGSQRVRHDQVTKQQSCPWWCCWGDLRETVILLMLNSGGLFHVQRET